MVLPARELCTEARRRGVVTVIDGAHAPAMVPVKLDELGCDFYGGNCHKWLLAPTGAGFLYLGAGSEDRLQPLQVSWGWRPDRERLDERDEFGSTPRLRALEFEGTRDPCPWLAVPEALAFQEGIGWERIRRRNAGLVELVRARLAGGVGLRPVTPTHPELHGFMTAFRLPEGTQPAALRAGLWEQRIETPVIERPEGLLLRVSTHFYNTEDEIARLAEVLPDLLRRSG
jgi:isopenicillin-N epimerase